MSPTFRRYPAALLTLLAGFFLACCNDPHNLLTDNPNDPSSPSYTPRAPVDLRLSGTGESSRSVSWTETSSAPLVYTIERRMGTAGAFAVLGSVTTPATSYIDTTTITTDSIYYYRVTCRSQNGFSAASALVSLTLPFPAPSGLRMTCVSLSAVILDWTDNSTFESGFRIEASADGGPFTVIDASPRDSTQRTIGQLSPVSTYRFRVAAITPRNVSGYSNTIGVRSVTQDFERIYSVNATQGIDAVSSLAFSPDGQTLAAGGSGTIDLFRAGAGTSGGVLSHGGLHPVSDLVFGAGVLASVRWGQVDVWDPAGMSLRRTLVPGVVSTVSFDRQGDLFACGTDTGMVLLDPQTWSEIRRFGQIGVSRIARLSPDGRTIAAGSSAASLALYRASDGAISGSIPGQSALSQMAYSPDGSVIAAANPADLTVRLWDAGTGSLLHVLPGQTRAGSIAFSPDGRWVAASDRLEVPLAGQNITGNALLWNVSDGSTVKVFSGNPYTSAVAFNPYGNLFAVGMSGKVEVWAVRGAWVPAP